jgi:uncharacterized membrane protein
MSRVAERLDRAEQDLARLNLELSAIRRLVEAEEAFGAEPAAAELELDSTAEPAPPVQMWPPPQPTPARRTPKPKAARPRREFDLSQLFGPRALAWAGGVVTLLGVVFVFALAANRGWIGPVERVLLGACASAFVFALGLLAHRRYGNLYAAVSAVGAGLAGGYVTLLVAAARYDLLEAVPALVVAFAIAAVGTATALRWRSETVASIGLVGAILVPLVTILDGGVTPLGTGFALLVLVGAAVVGVRMDWPGLLIGAGVAGALEIASLVLDEGEGAPPRVLALACAYAAIYLATGLARGPALDAVSRGFVLGSATLVGLAIPQLEKGRVLGLDTEGTLFVAVAVVYLAVAGGLFARIGWRDASLLVGALGALLGAIGVAQLLDGPSLVVAWSAQAVLLAWLAGRARDGRIAVGALAYLALAVGHAVLLDAPPEQLLEAVARPASGVVAVLVAAAACAGVGLLAPRWPAVTGSGRLNALAGRVVELRTEIGIAVCALAVAGAAYAVALGILELVADFGRGHVVVLGVWGAAALAALVAGLHIGRTALRIGGLAGVVAVLLDLAAVAGSLSSTERAAAGLVAAAVVLAASVLHERGSSAVGPVALGVPVGGALALWAAAQQWHGESLGLAMLGIGLVCAVLAAAHARRRNLATLLWATGLAVSLPAPALIADGTWAVLAWSSAASGLAVLGAIVGERRLVAAACAPLGLALASSLTTLAAPDALFLAGRDPAGGVLPVAFCTAALAVLAVSLGRIRGAATDAFDRTVDDSIATRGALFAAAAGLGLYGLSLAVLALVAWLGDAATDAEFQRGHTMVSAVWAIVALGLLVAGLRRGSRFLRAAGLVLIAVTLVKIFLFDLARLDSITRALSFLAVGAVLLLAGFFTQRLAARTSEPA